MADRLGAEAQEALTEYGRSKTSLSRFVLLIAFVVVVGLCMLFSFVERPWSQKVATQPLENDQAAPLLVLVPGGTATPSAFIKVQSGVGEREDLFLCETEPTVMCSNLTQSPAIAELWPVADAAGEGVVYYGMSEGQTEVFHLSLATNTSLPLTVRAGSSRLHTDYEIAPIVAPAFSPGGLWVAFPAQATKGDAIELFVAQTDGQNVRRVTDLGYQVSDYIWLDDRTLAIGIQRSDGTFQQWKAQLEAQRIQLEPLP